MSRFGVNRIKAAWHYLVTILLIWRHTTEETVANDTEIDAQREAEKNERLAEVRSTAARTVQRSDQTEYGEFYFRDTILDQLERYFMIIRRMRRHDREAYDLYTQIGARILPERQEDLWAVYGDQNLVSWWRTHRPSFGMVMYGTRKDAKAYDGVDKYIKPFAIHFTKYDRAHTPTCVQPVNRGDIYKCTVYWDKLTQKRKAGTTTEFAVVIGPDCEVQVLKILEESAQTVRARRGRDRGQTFQVPQRRWCINEFFVDWAKQHESPVEGYLARLFIEVANTYTVAANSMVQVNVTQGSLAAVFSVNILRTPYFFKDRNVTAVSGGSRKPIFHLVRTHTRALPGGAIVPVRTHFRGERSFLWNGYHVSITIPGWHHFSVSEFDLGAIDEETIDSPDKDVAGIGWLGSEIAKAEREGRGRVRRNASRRVDGSS